MWTFKNRITNRYDQFDRVTQQEYTDGTADSFVYSTDGRLSRRYETGGSRCGFEYDSLGRLIRSKETDYTGSLIQRTEHMNDNANRLISQSCHAGGGIFSESGF